MSDPALPPPLSHLPTEEKARRAASFGAIADHYERYRPGPLPAAVEWFLPSPVSLVVDLGAGTGALTRLLTGRAEEVVAVEPDDRMRAVLTDQVPGVRAVQGYGESIPLPNGSADVVLASSSWHWMEPKATLAEVARVLRPGGALGALWTGPDEEGPFVVQARELLARQRSGDAELILADAGRQRPVLEIPPGVPFSAPEHEVFRWDVALSVEDLIGLLGTLSWFILMDDDQRTRVFAEARRLLHEVLGLQGDETVDVGFRVDAWRSRRDG